MTPTLELGQCALSSNRIAILLATYNGEKYLDEQIRSLFAQTHHNFVIIARDDHSTDRTPAILARWAEENPNQMVVVSDERGNLGSRDNFSLLMERCQSPYFVFCGQDDVWIPQKLEVLIKTVQQMESRFGKEVPILVHSDVKIVDDNLHEISRSFIEYKSANITRDRRLHNLLFYNVVVGCSFMANRVLLNLASPVPQDFPHEDWWVTLVAASCGVIHTILEPTVLYRQHGNNQVGSGPEQQNPRWNARVLQQLWSARHVLQQPTLLRTRMAKGWRGPRSYAILLLRTVGDSMPDHKRTLLQAFCLPLLSDEIAVLPWSRRVWLFARFLEIQVRLFPAALRTCY